MFLKNKGGMAMPELKCGVVTCVHNKQNYCDLGSIEVVGSSAQTAEQTSCGSFVEKKGNCCSNSTQTPSATCNIVCQACECTYNEAKKCHAGKISVTGSDACRTEETECATFKKGN